MTERIQGSIFKDVDLHCRTNNTKHHTSEISVDQLLVRRGQPFNVTLKLTQPFNSHLHPLTLHAKTGEHPSEGRGTMSSMSVPDGSRRSHSAKATWKLEVDRNSSLQTGVLNLTITPSADVPIGEYVLLAKHRGEEKQLATVVVLFNAWCSDDSVFLRNEAERQEYVMNEQGTIYKGSGNYIFPMGWDFGQFEDSMVSICMKMLDLSHKHMADAAGDVSARCDPIYVSRVVSAMINSQDDRGVLEGNWGESFRGGVAPSHWNGSFAILKQWQKYDHHPVKYGQCWVFAGVMCSVMRLLGIPCRVITNFSSAHDTNGNLIIDTYHADYGLRERESHDSVWNYHVWVEGWMKRPDLEANGKYDGWQAVDPTPQEMSGGVYCCGPAPVKAILDGETHLKYDIPFVFAEVNADCIDWLVKADGSKVKIWSDTKRVGQNISTKAVGSNKRLDITDSYKHREGSQKERAVFKYACTRDYSRPEEFDDYDESYDYEMEEEEVEELNGERAENEEVDETPGSAVEGTPGSTPLLPHFSMTFREVTPPMSGKDVSLKLVLCSQSSEAKQLSVNLSVQAMRYNGTPAVTIQTAVKEEQLEPWRELSIPILVPYSAYCKHMVNCDSMKVSAVVTDKQNSDNTYLGEHDVVLLDPPISITVSGQVRQGREATGEVVFRNPVNETLRNCSLTLAGSGLWKEEFECKIPDLKRSSQVRVKFSFFPYKTGMRTLMVVLNCSAFRDIKSSCIVNVSP